MRMSASEAAAHLRKCAKEISKTIEPVMYEYVMVGRGYAILMSSGPLTQEDREELGWPYSKRHPKPEHWSGGDAGVLNVDTDRFRHRWQVKTHMTPFGVSGVIYNNDPRADKIVKGLSRAVPRPIDKKVENYVILRQSDFERKMALKLDKLFNG